MTGGIYYKVANVDDLQHVYTQIDQLEKSEATQKIVLIKTPLYHWPLLGAFVIFMFIYSKY